MKPTLAAFIAIFTIFGAIQANAHHYPSGSYSYECVRHFDKHISSQAIHNCGYIRTQRALGCVKHFTNLSDRGIYNCSFINHRYQLECIQHFNKMTDGGIYACSYIDNERALACVKSFSSISDAGIRGCGNHY